MMVINKFNKNKSAGRDDIEKLISQVLHCNI